MSYRTGSQTCVANTCYRTSVEGSPPLKDQQTDQSHKSQNISFPYPTKHHSEQKCAHFCSEWCIVRYGPGALWDLWIWSSEATENRMAIFDMCNHLSSVFFKCLDIKLHNYIYARTYLPTSLPDYGYKDVNMSLTTFQIPGNSIIYSIVVQDR